MRKRWKALLRRFYRLYQEAHVPFFAAALAYYALLSLMPLLFLLVGLFGFRPHDPNRLLNCLRRNIVLLVVLQLLVPAPVGFIDCLLH